MSFVEFEPAIPASEQAKAVHALDRLATVTGYCETKHLIFFPAGSLFLLYNSWH
jgi:hypothetical protein